MQITTIYSSYSVESMWLMSGCPAVQLLQVSRYVREEWVLPGKRHMLQTTYESQYSTSGATNVWLEVAQMANIQMVPTACEITAVEATIGSCVTKLPC